MDKSALAKLRKLRDDLTKEYGTAVTRQDTVKPKYEAVSTGSVTLDVATCIGGYPMGRITVVWGPEGCGKTTMAIQGMKNAQRQYPDRLVGYIDMEQTFDWSWAEAHGLLLGEDRILHVYPENSEDVSDQIKKMLNTGLFSMIVVDSIGGMESKVAFEKKADESNMGKNAQIITRMSKNVAVHARKHDTAVIFISQVRADFKSHQGFDTFAGPKGMKHANSMVIKFSRTGTPALTTKIGDDIVPVGIEFKAKVDRSKVGPGGRSGTFVIVNQDTEKWGPVGLDTADEAVSIIDMLGLANKRGSWYDLHDGTSHNGRAAVKEHLRANPHLIEEVRQKALDSKAGDVIPEVEVEFSHTPPADEVDA